MAPVTSADPTTAAPTPTAAGPADPLYDDDAWLYDLLLGDGTDDDTVAEVAWVLARLARSGPVGRVLEPGCGSGRLFPALWAAGATPVGVDRSAEMLRRAAARRRPEGAEAELVEADLTRFSLGEPADGAVCPLGTLAYLPTDRAMVDHLTVVREACRPGARYLFQLDLWPLDLEADVDDQPWEVDDGEHTLRARWWPAEIDLAARVEVQRADLRVVAGPRRGVRHVSDHRMRLWDWAHLHAAVDAAGWRYAAAWEGEDGSHRRLRRGPDLETRSLVWHELVADV